MKKVEYPEDCIRIKKVLLELGYDLNLYEVERFWMDYSRKQGVSWSKPDETHLRDGIAGNLIILDEIPFEPRG
ncbi:hypothetical protein IIB79_11935 [candidate division KSB1 bacterium]|nr:hypothetical protein [candidate division KSB1 bacterium]